jgi:dephospho-CoA kinase
VRRIGLTGGIGSGKSTAAALLAERGAHVIDADAIAREVVEIGSAGLTQVAQAFPGVLAPDGSLDRPALAARVFGDQEQRTLLESITHPLIGAEVARRMELLPDDAVVVYDVPLLAETGARDRYDFVVVVEAPLELRLARLVDRGLPEDQARARIATQATDEQRRAVADVVLDNGGDREALATEVDAAWPQISGRG